jgi:hypothetical protein
MLWTFSQQQPVKIRGCLNQTPQPISPHIKLAAILEYIGHRCTENARAITGLTCIGVPFMWLCPMFVTKKPAISARSP